MIDAIVVIRISSKIHQVKNINIIIFIFYIQYKWREIWKG